MRRRAAYGGNVGPGGSPTDLRTQPRNEKFFTLFSKAGSNSSTDVLPRPGFDVRYAVQRIDMNACDVRMFPQAPLDELNARGTAPSTNCNAERFYVVASFRSVKRWRMCHEMNQPPALVRV